MKRFLLCFLSVPLMLLLPAAADRLTPRREALVKVCIGGETKELSAEEYVASAVAACPTASEPAAREALAVVIRTNVMHARLYGTVHEGYLFCDDPGCCFALADPGDEAVSAASATSGRYLVRDGLPVELPFSECCGSGSGEGANSPFSAAVTAASPCEDIGRKGASPCASFRFCSGLRRSRMKNALFFTAETKSANSPFSARKCRMREGSCGRFRSPRVSLRSISRAGKPFSIAAGWGAGSVWISVMPPGLQKTGAIARIFFKPIFRNCR